MFGVCIRVRAAFVVGNEAITDVRSTVVHTGLVLAVCRGTCRSESGHGLHSPHDDVPLDVAATADGRTRHYHMRHDYTLLSVGTYPSLSGSCSQHASIQIKGLLLWPIGNILTILRYLPFQLSP